MVSPEQVAVGDIQGSLALVVRTFNGTRTLTRTFHTSAAARRAADRAAERGDHVGVLLVRLVPILTAADPLKLVLSDDAQDGAA